MATKLTAHFTLEELTRSDAAARLGNPNNPNEKERRNLVRLAQTLEQVRDVLGGKPIHISSGFRNERVNAAVGGSRTSAHRYGLAADFTCPQFGSVLDVCYAIRDSGIEFDQLIYEYGRWIHLGLCDCEKPRRQVLRIAQGTGYQHGLPKRGG